MAGPERFHIGRSRFLSVDDDALLEAIQVVGRYHDTLHYEDGTWRFHRRAATFET